MSTKIVAARHTLRGWTSRIGLIASVVAIVASCSDPTGVADVTSVLVTPTTSTFTFLYDTLRFTAVARNARGEAIPGHSFTWSVEPAGVLDVRSDGLVTAIGPGTARVTATSDTISGSASVSVAQVVTSVVSVTVPIRFAALGDSTQFGAEARDRGGAEVKGTSFTYRSSNDSVVSVSPTGSMKAISPGFAYVAATAVGKSDSIRVDVIQDVATVVIAPDTAMIQDGTTRQFTATLKDRNGYLVTGRPITWATTDSRVVTVSASGLATAKGNRLGAATLTATTVGAIGQAPIYVFASFIALSAFGEETCALTSAGRPYCWGLLNYYPTQRSEIPLAVTGTPPLRSIGPAAELSCGLSNGGTAYCWPRGGLPAATAVAGIGALASLAAGQQIYALTSSGAAYTWNDQALTPTVVPGGLSFTSINASGGNTCATVASGAAYCWGSNLAGSIGDSTYVDRTAPTPVYGGLTFASVSTGGAHSCGITTSGGTYCWGSNGFGQFGDGTTTSSPIPVPAAGSLALTSVTVGGGHTCGLDATGVAYCWGFNDEGNLGDGTQVRRLSPVRVTGGLTFALLSAGGQHTCGITTSGALYCWGRNYDRELGDGTPTRRMVPTLVAGSRP